MKIKKSIISSLLNSNTNRLDIYLGELICNKIFRKELNKLEYDKILSKFIAYKFYSYKYKTYRFSNNFLKITKKEKKATKKNLLNL